MINTLIGKPMTAAAGQALDLKARKDYGAECVGVSWDDDSATVHLNDDQDTANAGALLDAVAAETIQINGLQITVTLGTLLNDQVTLIADPSDVKTVLISICMDDATGGLVLVSQEKTTGTYGGYPAAHSLARDLNQYTIAAAGSALVEV